MLPATSSSASYLNHSQAVSCEETVIQQESERFKSMDQQEQANTIDQLESNFKDFISKINKALAAGTQLWLNSIAEADSEVPEVAAEINKIAQRGSTAYDYRSKLYEALKSVTESTETIEKIEQCQNRFKKQSVTTEWLPTEQKVTCTYVNECQTKDLAPKQVSLASANTPNPTKKTCCVLL